MRAAIVAVLLSALAGCQSLGDMAQSAIGHWRLLSAARPVDDWLVDPATPEALRQRLVLSQRIRDYAVAELKLPDNASYRRYADLHRPAAVWNVVAAPELSLTLRTWCFPVVGCVAYRGYYSRAGADAAAAPLRSAGDDVTVYPVPAYSTLGKLGGSRFADPLLNTFIDEPEADLAGLVFHELAHQVAYAAGDTEFNESFATSVERIGVARWLDHRALPPVDAAHAADQARRADFDRLAAATRDRLDAVYRSAATDAEKRVAKAAAFAALREQIAALKAGPWHGDGRYDARAARANNASVGVLSAYADFVPQFERLFEREGGDFDRFYAEVRRLATLPKDARRAALQNPGPTKASPMSEIHIRRDHQLGLERARALAGRFIADAESKLGLTCVVTPGDTADTVAVSRSGLDGTVTVAADHVAFDARLGLLLSGFRKTVEAEIEKRFDALVASESASRPQG